MLNTKLQSCEMLWAFTNWSVLHWNWEEKVSLCSALWSSMLTSLLSPLLHRNIPHCWGLINSVKLEVGDTYNLLSDLHLNTFRHTHTVFQDDIDKRSKWQKQHQDLSKKIRLSSLHLCILLLSWIQVHFFTTDNRYMSIHGHQFQLVALGKSDWWVKHRKWCCEWSKFSNNSLTFILIFHQIVE